MYLMDVPRLLTEKYEPVDIMHIFIPYMSKAVDEVNNELYARNKTWKKAFIINDIDILMYVPIVPIVKNKPAIISRIDEELVKMANGTPLYTEEIQDKHLYNLDLFNFIMHGGFEHDGAEASIINFDGEHKTKILETLYESIVRLEDNLNNYFVGKYEIIKPNAPFNYSVS